MATIALSPIPPIPSPGDRDFETKIGKVLSHMPTLATELQTIAETVVESAQLVDVEGNATVAATAASQASISAGSAVAAAGTAATQANNAKAEATKAARSKSDAALAASQSGTNAVAALGAAQRAEAAVLAAETIATTTAEAVATQAAADAATQAVSGVIAQAQASADAAATSAADANTAKNAAQAAATTAGQSVAAIATHAQTAQTASTAASSHAHAAGLRAAESLASAQQATSAGQAATQGAADVREILDNLNTGPVVSVNGKFGAVNLVKADLGLGNVDNTSDLDKPISTATQAALGGKSDSGHAHGAATTSAAGFMSAADKTKLDGVATNANNYTHPTGDGNLHVPATGTTNSGKVLTAGATAGSLSWVAPLALGSTAGTALGTAAAGTATTAARSDHVHPVQTSVSGNAGTATKLETARTINGVSFDGSANITINAVDSTARELAITAGTTAQYWRGDKSWQALNKSAVGLGNVDNTSDASKPISTAVQTALNAKQDTLVSGSNIKTINGNSVLGSGDIQIASSGLTNFNESKSTSGPNSSVPAMSLKPASGNADFVIAPAGTGSLVAVVPDSTYIGGNKRGGNAVDFQITRTTAIEVASGSNSVICGGYANTASGYRSFVGGGQGNIASGESSSILGGNYGNTRGLIGAKAFGFGAVNSYYGQAIEFGCHAASSASVVSLTANGSATLTAQNLLTVPNKRAYRVKGNVLARNSTSGDCKEWTFEALIKRGYTAADTVLVGSPIISSSFSDAGAETLSISVIANTTQGALLVRGHGGDGSSTIYWMAVLNVVEVGGY